ncbi:Collagen alpha-1(XIV) chain [Liparis tanakae]|uniref:Collagen alpha-1(XIV) chain n=1 Tax=Liparis tanakae TaxID=230148 RepID=A0A4Z2F148_9TELE|nr:Collagen alpha-1(XIV) chain [Liparis tanakae]
MRASPGGCGGRGGGLSRLLRVWRDGSSAALIVTQLGSSEPELTPGGPSLWTGGALRWAGSGIGQRAEDEFTCKTSSISDIVILVDGSWSIGRINFRLVRTFLENLVRAFSVEFDQTRIGLALTYILETSFKPESGSRPGVPKIGILITDGKSQDDVIPPAQSLREAGIELFAIGVKNADESELKAIASPPEETHVYNVADFSVMSDIVDGLTQSVCERVEQLDKQLQGQGHMTPPEGGGARGFITELTDVSF